MSKLTIAIPIYNGREYIKRLIGDLEEQYDGTFSLLVRENFSDNTAESIIKSASIPIDYKLHDENYGYDYNIFSLYSDCKTEYIWFLGCDDRILPGSIKLLISYIIKNTPNALICNWESYHEDGKLQSEREIDKETFRCESFEDFSKKMGAQFFLSSVILNRGLSIDLVDPNYVLGFAHWYLFIKSAEKGSVDFFSEKIVRHITGIESYLPRWIEIFFIIYPTFVYRHTPNQAIKDIFINQNLNLSMTVNILHKRSMFGRLTSDKLKQIFYLHYRYPKFYIFNMIPLILNTHICKCLMRLKNVIKEKKTLNA